MGRFGYHVVDSDAHIFEALEMYRQMADRFMDTKNAGKLHALADRYLEERPNYEPYMQAHLWPLASKIPVIDRDRPMGVHDGSQKAKFRNISGHNPAARTAKAPLDPEGRLLDMEDEGIDTAVIFPSGIAAWIAIEDEELENAIYSAYNRWMAKFCSVAPDRLKYVGVNSMRDAVEGAKEIRRAAQDPNMVGIYIQTHIDGKLLEHPDFHPLWEAAQGVDLPVDIHQASSALPPYGMGMWDTKGNRFLQHASSNPMEMMRAVACMIGAGLFDRYPGLRAAYLEAGCGWLPYWLERLDEHLELMPESVPNLKRDPTDVFRGGNCFISFEPDEKMLPHVADYIGDDLIVYASDYPHYDGKFPDSVRTVAERTDLTDEAKAKFLGGNALRLYPRLSRGSGAAPR